MSTNAWLQQLSEFAAKRPWCVTLSPHMTDRTESWQEYRRRRNLLLFAFFGYMPVVGLIAFLTTWALKSTTPVFVAAFSWMAFYAFAGIRFRRSKCLRCGRWFFAKWSYTTTCSLGDVSTAVCPSMLTRLCSDSC
jgi:hypothetical protein